MIGVKTKHLWATVPGPRAAYNTIEALLTIPLWLLAVVVQAAGPIIKVVGHLLAYALLAVAFVVLAVTAPIWWPVLILLRRHDKVVARRRKGRA